MFRRMSQKKAKCTLELRHQRTCDVCFDWAILRDQEAGSAAPEGLGKRSPSSMINNDGIPRSDNFKPHNYMYKMIETMLPKAMVDENRKNIRLLEIWAQSDTVRKGWIKVIQK